MKSKHGEQEIVWTIYKTHTHKCSVLSQSRNASLQEALDHTRGELSRSEKSGKEAEINLSLQSVRNDQIISSLRRELSTLKTHPRLDGVVAELEERNRDMDELLKSKCAEIEDNDDRILE